MPSNDSAMVPDQKRCDFTRSRECNAHPVRMPRTPNGMPPNQNDRQEMVANDAGVGPKVPSASRARVWTDSEFDDPFMMASPVTMRPNTLKRCRPAVTGHQARLDPDR